MRGERESSRTVLATVFGFVVVQALFEILAIAWLHRDLLLAPYRFFGTQAWDPGTKLYQALLVPLGLPDPLSIFLAPGVAAKLGVAPGLALAGLLWGAILAVVLVPLFAGRPTKASVPRVAAAILIIEVVVLAAFWLPSVKIPLDPSLAKLFSNYFRNALYDGFLFSVGLAFLSALALAGVGAAGSALGAASLGLAGCVLAGLFVGGGPAEAPETIVATASPPAARFNVVLVSIDSLRADHLGCYGYPRETSPALDRLAQEGVRFANASSVTSWTLPAHMSLLTGRSMMGHGVVTDDRSLTADVPTLAEGFKKAGYATKAIVSAPYLNSRYGFTRGFDDYDDRTIFFETNEDSYKSVTGPRLVDAAIDYLDDPDGERPFFLFLHFWDVHYDYAPGPPYDRMFDADYDGEVDGENFYFNDAIRQGMDPRALDYILALYDGEIRLVDDQIARLRAALAARGQAGNTVFVVTADHGDEFFEHGEKGHHRTLYEEVLDVPLLVYVPGVAPVAKVVDQQVSIIDIAPTLLSLVGAPLPEDLEGRDLAPLWSGRESAPRPAWGELYRKGSLNVQVSATMEGRKVIHHFNRRILEVYDLAEDPGEQVQLPRSGLVAATLTYRLRDWLNREWGLFDGRVRGGQVDAVTIDQETADMLEALGYSD
jgi:arylsulfatase A-like enzyme